ncbi:MAG TPA: HAD-IB family hydrolase [Puia sp.]|nr:HAD-IB family hydrolase [Puia sp.]
MNRRIAFFDFDGTITTKDTLLEFIKFSKGDFLFGLGFLLTSPWLVAFKLKLISNQRAKEKVLTFFFRNYILSRFSEDCDRFLADRLPQLIRPKALQEIAKLREKGAAVVIVSASPENWIKGWAEEMGAALIATRMETRQGGGRLTGRIEGNNCHGKEKVRRIAELYTLADYDEIYTYGDSSGDKPMLQLGTVAFYKPFR